MTGTSNENSLTRNITPLSGRFVTIIAFLVIMVLSILFALHPFKIWTYAHFFILLYLLIAHSKVGLIVIGLNFQLLILSYFAISGLTISLLFYGVFIVIVLALFYGNILGYRIPGSPFLLDKYIIIMLVYLTFSLLFLSVSVGYGSGKLRTFLMNVILFYLPIILVKKYSDFVLVVKGIMVYGILFTIFSILSYLGFEPIDILNISGRFAPMGMNSIWVARHFSYAILAELFFIHLYMKAPSKNIGKLVGLTLLIAIQFYFIFLTGSRGPLLSLMLAILFVILASIRLRFFYIVLIALAIMIVSVAALYFIPSNIADRLLTRDYSSQLTIQIRLAANLQALNMFWENKILGAGLGSFASVSYLNFPHNVFSETLAELGLVGFTIFITIIITGISYMFRLRKTFDRTSLLLLAAMFITAIVNINFGEQIGSNYYLYFSLGLINAALILTGKKKEGLLDEDCN